MSALDTYAVAAALWIVMILFTCVSVFEEWDEDNDDGYGQE